MNHKKLVTTLLALSLLANVQPTMAGLLGTSYGWADITGPVRTQLNQTMENVSEIMEKAVDRTERINELIAAKAVVYSNTPLFEVSKANNFTLNFLQLLPQTEARVDSDEQTRQPMPSLVPADQRPAIRTTNNAQQPRPVIVSAAATPNVAPQPQSVSGPSRATPCAPLGYPISAHDHTPTFAYATPTQLFVHSAAWSLATKMKKDGLSIQNGAALTVASFLGTLGTTALQRKVNAIQAINDRMCLQPNDVPALNRKIYAMNALSVLPYLAGQNPEALLGALKHVKKEGVKQSFKDAGEALRTFWSKKTSPKARWAFVARTFGPIATILMWNGGKNSLHSWQTKVFMRGFDEGFENGTRNADGFSDGQALGQRQGYRGGYAAGLQSGHLNAVAFLSTRGQQDLANTFQAQFPNLNPY